MFATNLPVERIEPGQWIMKSAWSTKELDKEHENDEKKKMDGWSGPQLIEKFHTMAAHFTKEE